MNERKDYYKILGVQKTANDQQIKKAYRKLAIKYHPDKNKDDKQAQQKFKEISQAYSVLSDPQQKKQYDNPNVNFNPFFQSNADLSGFKIFLILYLVILVLLVFNKKLIWI